LNQKNQVKDPGFDSHWHWRWRVEKAKAQVKEYGQPVSGLDGGVDIFIKWNKLKSADQHYENR